MFNLEEVSIIKDACKKYIGTEYMDIESGATEKIIDIIVVPMNKPFWSAFASLQAKLKNDYKSAEDNIMAKPGTDLFTIGAVLEAKISVDSTEINKVVHLGEILKYIEPIINKMLFNRN